MQPGKQDRQRYHHRRDDAVQCGQSAVSSIAFVVRPAGPSPGQSSGDGLRFGFGITVAATGRRRRQSLGLAAVDYRKAFELGPHISSAADPRGGSGSIWIRGRVTGEKPRRSDNRIMTSVSRQMTAR
jgi:hypothetical protein